MKKLDLVSINEVTEQSPYSCFELGVNSYKTLRDYKCYVGIFLNTLPDEIYTENNIPVPQDNLKDKVNKFITLTKQNQELTKRIISVYVTDLKVLETDKKMSPSCVRGRLKGIKHLFASNEIEFFWKNINKGLTKVGKSQDRAYRRKELQMMLSRASLVDKVIVTMATSGGFRLEAWDYLTWGDIVFFYKNPDEGKYFQNSEPMIKGMAIRIYKGDPAEYWTHGTPEAANYIIQFREEWRSKFGKYPTDSDPFLYHQRRERIVRLAARGVASRMTDLIKLCGLRPKLKEGQKRHTIMPDHGMRKYCNTMMRRAKVYFPDKEDLQGRSLKQESSYERYEEQDFERWPEYQKAIPLLTISDTERNLIELSRIKEEKNALKQKVNENTKLQEMIKEEREARIRSENKILQQLGNIRDERLKNFKG